MELNENVTTDNVPDLGELVPEDVRRSPLYVGAGAVAVYVYRNRATIGRFFGRLFRRGK